MILKPNLKVIHPKHMPNGLGHVHFFITLWLVMDRLKAPEWAVGALGACALVVALASVYLMYSQETVTLYEDEDNDHEAETLPKKS